MGKARKETKEALEDWLLEFEEHIGRGVVVSLLVEKGKVSFVSCVDRKRYLSSEEEEDDDESGICLRGKKSIKKLVATKLAQHYIG